MIRGVRCGWCGGRSGNGHWVQPQVQGWSFICWRRALFLRLHFLCQLGVELLQWLTALWTHSTRVSTYNILTFNSSSHVCVCKTTMITVQCIILSTLYAFNFILNMTVKNLESHLSASLCSCCCISVCSSSPQAWLDCSAPDVKLYFFRLVLQTLNFFSVYLAALHRQHRLADYRQVTSACNLLSQGSISHPWSFQEWLFIFYPTTGC